MIKKIGIVLVAIFLIAGCNKGIIVKPALADELSLTEQLQKLPALKQGIAFSLIDNKVSYLSTIECLNWKGITLEAGYSSKDKIVGVISYQLLKLKDLGVNVPILDLVEFNLGLYGGWGRLDIQDLDSSEWDAGASITLLNIKW